MFLLPKVATIDGCTSNVTMGESTRVQIVEQKNPSRIRVTDCPFMVTANLASDLWTINKVHEVHNHEIPTDPKGLKGISAARRLQGPGKEMVRSMFNAGHSSSGILTSCRDQFGYNLVTLQELYNEKKGLKREFLAGGSLVEAVYGVVERGNFTTDFDYDETSGAIRAMFFSHPSSVDLARRFSSTFLLDCTYLTNKYRMPFLNFVGITSTYGSFNAGFALLPCETEEAYMYGLLERFPGSSRNLLSWSRTVILH